MNTYNFSKKSKGNIFRKLLKNYNNEQYNKCTYKDMDDVINYIVKANTSTLLTASINLLTFEACMLA